MSKEKLSGMKKFFSSVKDAAQGQNERKAEAHYFEFSSIKQLKALKSLTLRNVFHSGRDSDKEAEPDEKVAPTKMEAEPPQKVPSPSDHPPQHAVNVTVLLSLCVNV